MATVIDSHFFTAASRLTNQDRGRALTFIDKFLENPKQPGLSLERIQRSRSNNLWSARVTDDLRAIIYQDGESYVLLHVDRHDEAYTWASRYDVGRHSQTGALQVVQLPVIAAAPAPESRSQKLFDQHGDEYLLSLGIPEVWLPTLRQIAEANQLLDVMDQLPADVAERLLELADGKLVAPPAPISPTASLTDQAPSNLFVVRSKDDLRFLLDAPLAKWIAFLHPTQKKLAQASFNGPVKVTGSAGTGKTVVAMHRARHLAAAGKRILVTSFVQTLCRNIERNLQLFCSTEELSRITVTHVHKLAADLLTAQGENWQPLGGDQIESRLKDLAAKSPCPLDAENLFVEWQDIIEAQSISSWEQYRSASRAGRGRALSMKDRKAVWSIIERLQQQMAARRETTFSGLCRRATELLSAKKLTSPFDAVIVDETQDLSASELKMLAALTSSQNLMLVGDGGQRIYAGKSSLKSLGIDVRGRSHVLRLNYRTTEQIRRFADNLVASEADDLDGGQESRLNTHSLLSGPEPIMKSFATRPLQSDFVAEQIQQLLQQGRSPDEIAVFARQARNLDQIETRLKRADIPSYRLSKEEAIHDPAVNLGTMHRAKGLEFKIVFVIDADDETIPAANLLRKKTDEQLREDFLMLERQLLYVSVTRARDVVFITWAGEPSRFLRLSSEEK